MDLQDYRTYFMNRSLGRGGGVCILVNRFMKCDLVLDFCVTTADYEVFCVRTGQIVLAVCYRPPSGRPAEFFFLSFFDSLLHFVNISRFNIVVGGDFNINLLGDSSTARDFLSLICANGCVNTVNLATRVAMHTESLINLFITNIDVTRTHTFVMTHDISDHCPILFTTKTDVKKTLPRPVLSQSINGRSLDAFRNDVINYDWSYVLTMSDANAAYDVFLDKFIEIYVLHFPYKVYRPPRKARKE